MIRISQIKLLLVFALTSMLSVAHAQPPGFMGKRLSVSLESNITPSYTGLIYTLESDVYLPLFNFRPGIQAEYVVSRKTALTLGYHAINTAFKSDNRFVMPGSLFTDEKVFYLRNVIAVKGHDFEVGANFYTSGLPAPLGRYVRLALSFASAKPDFDTSEFNIRARKSNFSDSLFTFASDDMLPCKTTVLCLEFGKQRVFAKHFSVKYSLGFNFAFKLHTELLDNYSWGSANPDLPTIDMYAEKVRNRMFNNYFIAFKVGIGYLL